MKNLLLLLSFFVFLNACKDKVEPEPNLAPQAFNVATRISGTDLILTWSKAQDPNGDAITYSVVQGDTLARNLTDTTYTIKNIPYNTEIRGSVVAKDVKGLSTTSAFSIKTEEDPYVLIPDANFEQALIDLKIDDVKDGKLLRKNAENVLKLDIGSRKIANLSGIEVFENLQGLYVYNNQLTSLDVSKNTNLTYLSVSMNQLTVFDVSKNTKLNSLIINDNQLTTLDVSKSINLRILWSEYNRLTTIDLSKNTNLESLNISNNKLTSLDLSKNIKLIVLYTFENLLSALDISKNTNLEYLHTQNNKLISFNVSKNTNLKELWCQNNEISTICVSSLNHPTAYWQKDVTAQYKVCN